MPVGTVTCAEIESDFPVGVDDHGLFLAEGIITYWQQPAGEEELIQFMDDPTCTADSEAWKYMIGYLLDPEALYGSGLLCDFYRALPGYYPPPANLETVLAQLAAAEQLCE